MICSDNCVCTGCIITINKKQIKVKYLQIGIFDLKSKGVIKLVQEVKLSFGQRESNKIVFESEEQFFKTLAELIYIAPTISNDAKYINFPGEVPHRLDSFIKNKKLSNSDFITTLINHYNFKIGKSIPNIAEIEKLVPAQYREKFNEVYRLKIMQQRV